MKRLKEITVSKFKNFKVPNQIETITLFDELRNIKNGSCKQEILKCRDAYSANDLALYNKTKSLLPSVTFCGIYINSRKINNLFYYNNLMIIDIDKLDSNEFQKLRSQLCKDEYILALWTSPSGLGIKGLVRIESTPELHKLIFESLSIYFQKKYEVELDKSGNDITRLCFTSWDPKIYYNKDSKIYSDYQTKSNDNKIKNKFNYTQNQIVPKSNDNQSIRLIESIIDYLTKNEKSITSNYQDWITVALAISSSFSQDLGINYFMRLSRLDKSKHDESKSFNLIKKCYENSGSKKERVLTIKSISYLAEQLGFKKSIKNWL